jgi:crotonobetainyl-CoA:carnitine CoA-transferase CaiB-like acyl-CoA transferase
MQSVLEDIRVLDFGRFVACPYCGMLLADMGAEVIRVERPGGEEDRTVGLTGPDGQNLAYASYARNKKGITVNEALEKLEKVRIPCSPVRNLDEIVDDPHVRSENMIEYVDMNEPGLGKLPISGIQAKLSKTPGRVKTRAPRVGEHNDEIYQGLLGYDKALLNELKEKAVV